MRMLHHRLVPFGLLLPLLNLACGDTTTPQDTADTADVPEEIVADADADADVPDVEPEDSSADDGQLDLVPDDAEPTDFEAADDGSDEGDPDVVEPDDGDGEVGETHDDAAEVVPDVEPDSPEADACVPDCADRECGDDGCGGSCGGCPGSCTGAGWTAPGVCTDGACVWEVAVVCNDWNPCTQDLCEPMTGCSHAPADGVACDDDDPCTIDDACTGGVCAAGAPYPCTGLPCVVATCIAIFGAPVCMCI